MGMQEDIQNKEIDVYLLYNKMLDESTPKLKREYRKQYETALKELEALEERGLSGN